MSRESPVANSKEDQLVQRRRGSRYQEHLKTGQAATKDGFRQAIRSQLMMNAERQ